MTTRSRLRFVSGLILASTLLVSSAFATSKMPPNIDPRDLRPGMKGYGLTVMRGQKIERFQIEVIGVLYNKLPGQDMILVRCAGLNLEHTGVIAGMSGSPVFVKGPRGRDLLVGAVSYAFPFNKDPVAGVTPIKNMWPELDRPLRAVPAPQRLLPAGRRHKKVRRRRRRMSGMSARETPRPRAKNDANSDANSDDVGLNDAEGAAAKPARTAAATPITVGPMSLPGGLDPTQLQPIATPLSASGFHPDIVKEMQASFAELGFGAVQAGAVGGSAAGAGISLKSEPFQPGSAISLSLVRGDMNIAGIGTITWVHGKKFIAFGHPFRGLGQIHLPVGGAHIVWVTASQVNSFKMGMPLNDLGVLDQDRLPAIAGRIGPRAAMIPMQVRVRGKRGGTDRTWKVEIVDQPKFFPLAVGMVLGNALKVSEPIAQNAWATMKLTFELEGGYKPLVFEDMYVSLGGSKGLYQVRGLARRVATALVTNGFKRIRTKSVKAEFHIEEGRPMAFLEAVQVDADEVRVGQRPVLRVQFLRPNSKSVTVKLQLPKIPRDLAGQKMQIWVGAASAKPVERPQPNDVNDVLNSMRMYRPRNKLVAVIKLPGRSYMVRGERLLDLPAGIMGELSGHRRKIRLGHATLRVGKLLPWVIQGSGSITLQVIDEP